MGRRLVNTSVLYEAKLAREAELSYALIATATDYDAWRPHSDTVTAAEVFKTLKANADTSRLVAATVLDELHANVSASGENSLLEQVGSMSFSIMPRSEKQDPEHRKRLAYVLPEYFSGEQLN
ncbi:uncharacterized protein ARMOST_04397 [Armillaria ostoyae]|uniref:S-methyl-5'-thioadenosine phosphorylase n=1 Tax=Armillaria ostoyae TaxID=47428 RepID=A0A284QX87_ARMOS|nr:uncharacterized protein ARMOST_04397 [Armillaria ostoyae]